MKSFEPGRILVFRPGYLGDTLVALPAFWAIRNKFPRAHIAFLSNADPNNPHYVSARNVLPEHGLFDSWITYSNQTDLMTAARELWRLAAEIRSGRYDALFYLMHSRRTPWQIRRDSWFFRLAGIRRILCTGYAKANLILDKGSGPLPVVQSECEFLLNGLRSEGILRKGESPAPDMQLSDGEKGAAEQWLRSARQESDFYKPMVAVAPGSKWDSKTWDEGRFCEVILRLIRAYDVFPVVFGSEEDREKGARLLQRWKTGGNAAGALGVREAAATLRRCVMYLGNDTGTMHLAASVGTPCVAIFSALDWPGRWYPYGEGHRIFRRTVKCEGCRLPVSHNGKLCLELIGVEEVFAGCCEVLDRRLPPKPAARSEELSSRA